MKVKKRDMDKRKRERQRLLDRLDKKGKEKERDNEKY